MRCQNSHDTFSNSAFIRAPALMAVMFTSLSFAPGQVSKRATYAGAEDIPRTWDDAAMGSLEIPMASPAGSPRAVSAEYYYKIPVRIIYEQYPVYAPGREPAGYIGQPQAA